MVRKLKVSAIPFIVSIELKNKTEEQALDYLFNKGYDNEGVNKIMYTWRAQNSFRLMNKELVMC